MRIRLEDLFGTDAQEPVRRPDRQDDHATRPRMPHPQRKPDPARMAALIRAAARNSDIVSMAGVNALYREEVDRFHHAVYQEGWIDYHYNASPAFDRMNDQDVAFIARADLEQMKSMLTYIVRGERFCTGLTAGLADDGVLDALADRLEELAGDTTD